MPARLPAVLAGALICAVCFAIVRRERTVAAGICAAAMALSSQLLFTMSRHNMTDILLAAAGVCAIACLQRGWWAGFATAAACGILSKSVAGLLPIGAMAIWVAVRRDGHPWVRAAVAGAAAVAMALPWYICNFLAHRDWFLADMGFQLITTGSASQQTSPENHVWFYISRILRSDPAMAVILALALPAVWTALRRRDSTAVLLTGGALVYFAALMAFRFHSEQYLTWLLPWMILLAAVYSPVLRGRWAWIAAAALLSIFAIRAVHLNYYRSGSTIAAAPVLERYCVERRANTLYILGVDDEFYSAVLPLERVRYGWLDPAGLAAREHPHLAHLGILISARELAGVDARMPLYARRLREWGMNSTRAVSTGIAAHDLAEFQEMVLQHPESDFLVARAILREPGKDDLHRVAFANAEFALLESLASAGSMRQPAAWPCRM